MKQQLYEWIRNLSLFYVLLTALLQIVPDKKYEKYIRFFMGILMIFMLCIPIGNFWKTAANMMHAFEQSFQNEMNLQKSQTDKNLQEIWLNKGYEQVIEKDLDKLEEKYKCKIKIQIVNGQAQAEINF